MLFSSVSRGIGQFGYALAVGDFDGDRIDDLAIGVPRASCLGATAAGSVIVSSAPRMVWAPS